MKNCIGEATQSRTSLFLVISSYFLPFVPQYNVLCLKVKMKMSIYYRCFYNAI